MLVGLIGRYIGVQDPFTPVGYIPVPALVLYISPHCAFVLWPVLLVVLNLIDNF